MPSLGKDPLAKKPALGDVLRKKPLGAAVAEAPTPSEPKKQTSFPAAADAEDVSDVSSKSLPSLVLDDDLDLEDLGDVASRAPPAAGASEVRARTDAAWPPRAAATGTATKMALVDSSTIPLPRDASALESAASLRAALDRALGEKEDAVRARERAETALAKREDAEKTRDAVSAAAFEAEKKALAANAVSAETRAREAEDRCEAALRRHASALTSIISEKFAEQRDAWSAERSALETTTRECATRFEKAADAAAEAARRRARSLQHARTIPNPHRADVCGPPRPPPAAVAHRHANKIRDDSMESPRTSARRPRRRVAAAGAPAAPRVRRRGRRPRAHPRPELRPQPPSAASPTSPRSVSPRRSYHAPRAPAGSESLSKRRPRRPPSPRPRRRRGGGDVRAAGGPAGAPARGGRGGAATGVAVRR